LVHYEIRTFMPPGSRSDESEIEALREVLKCIESAVKGLERFDKKREPRLKTVIVNLQVSRNMVRHFLSNLGRILGTFATSRPWSRSFLGGTIHLDVLQNLVNESASLQFP
jgi:hypothetical protein